ncbi:MULTISPECIES: hypothetical protein [Flammeovirga]|uniref:Uncharacterized protein n=1 Tax=Flammeovirga agarivorans TaxID=2726742 RepID=A0A7X8XUA3_9BACT|nr:MULTISPECIES: hypothetical protein [Flammeovirga]NLR89915.1 hypothetical protein [Flammeovirga agarivorans]
MLELSKKEKNLSLTIADHLINDQGIKSEDEIENLSEEYLTNIIVEVSANYEDPVNVSEVFLKTFKGILKFDVAYLLRSNRCCS